MDIKMLVTLKLGDNLSQCPHAWQNFISDIIASEDYIPRDRVGDITIEYINKVLEPYRAYWDDPAVSLVFEDEKYKTLFLLRWS
jgi:hypothetical protein